MNTFTHFTFATLSAALPLTLWAQADYPHRPIRLIVTSAAGGSGDNIARIAAKLLATELKTTLVVDNRPGASGIIATETVVKATADGYTLLQTSSNLITNAASGRKLPYDVLKDLIVVANLATAEGYLVLTHPALGAANIKELVVLARKRNIPIPYGSPGLGNPIHFHTEALAQRAGIKLQHVPYKSLAPAITALLAGEIQLLLAPPIATRGHIEAGRIQVLAVVSAKRVAALPEVPTVEESGYTGFHLLGGWQGMFAPAGVPARALERLHVAIRNSVNSTEFKTFAANGGYVPSTATPAEFRAQILRDHKAFKNISKLVSMETQP